MKSGAEAPAIESEAAPTETTNSDSKEPVPEKVDLSDHGSLRRLLQDHAASVRSCMPCLLIRRRGVKRASSRIGVRTPATQSCVQAIEKTGLKASWTAENIRMFIGVCMCAHLRTATIRFSRPNACETAISEEFVEVALTWMLLRMHIHSVTGPMCARTNRLCMPGSVSTRNTAVRFAGSRLLAWRTCCQASFQSTSASC